MSVSYNLPNEILVKIFNFCDVYTLSQISMVCIQFNNVAKYILMKKSEHLLVTNQKSEKFRERCKPLLSSDINSKFITSYNWIYKKYKKRQINDVMEGYINHTNNNKCVLMTKNTVWFCGTNSNKLHAYNRAKNGTIEKGKKILCTDNALIKCFALCDDYIISSDINGVINRWEIKNDQNNFFLERLKIHDVHSRIIQINATSQHIITASKNSIKILKYTNDRRGCTEENEIFCGDVSSYIKSISFDPIRTKFAANSIYRYICKSSFLIYDIDKSYQIINKNFESECVQLIWENPHTILTCFYNSIKKIDIRTSNFVVRSWDFPKYYALCCSSDNMYTFMTGHYRAAHLWDQRQNVAIQTYVNRLKIHSLEFDSTHMYGCAMGGLFELDFTEKNHFNHKGIKKHFSNIY
ncbi:uncharacterized protein [Linepithema humile]|uniref:uncharacterized protein n=1 Tax=Linepithema humile TaxID=83485 RepID=UPI00351F313B